MTYTETDVSHWLKLAHATATKFAGRRDDEFLSAANAALAKALRKYDTASGVKFETFLTKLVRDEVTSVLRQEYARREAFALATDCGDKGLHLDQIARSPGSTVEVEECIRQLPTALRSVAVLYWIENHTAAETAERLGISVAEVNRRVKQARDLLARHLFEGPDAEAIPFPVSVGDRCPALVAA
jgi:RNA polymerase sigma factor (sigma-70 family)